MCVRNHPIEDAGKMADDSSMKFYFFSIAVAVLAGCNDRKEERFSTWSEAKHARAVERGWIPPFVPTSARDIHDVHDVDTNEQKLTFILTPAAIDTMVTSITPRTQLTGSAAERAVAAAGWDAGKTSAMEVFLMCTRKYSGALSVARKSGSVAYVTPVEWARDLCTNAL